MKSQATDRFWKLFRALPKPVRVQAYKAYAQFKRDPSHPGLNFEIIALGSATAATSPDSGSGHTANMKS